MLNVIQRTDKFNDQILRIPSYNQRYGCDLVFTAVCALLWVVTAEDINMVQELKLTLTSLLTIQSHVEGSNHFPNVDVLEGDVLLVSKAKTGNNIEMPNFCRHEWQSGKATRRIRDVFGMIMQPLNVIVCCFPWDQRVSWRMAYNINIPCREVVQYLPLMP